MSRECVSGRGGFTLIELMIVVGIIAVIASLVIPNFLMSRAASNETTAIASLRAYAAAQIAFKRNDCDADGVSNFSSAFRDLYYELDIGGVPVKLVSQSFADADSPENAACGYYFEDLTECPDATYDIDYEYGLAALPGTYGRTGVNTFVIDITNSVYQKDRKTGDPLNGEYPDIHTEGWTATGQ